MMTDEDARGATTPREDALWYLSFEVLRNAIYHTARRRFLDTCNRVASLILIVLGTSVVGQLGEQFHVTEKTLAVGATLVATLQLVSDIGVKARDHEFLQREYYNLLSEIEGVLEPSREQIAKWRAALTKIYGEEQPPMRALDIIAHNAACDSLGKSKDRLRLRWWQNWLSQLYSFNETQFPPVSESKPCLLVRLWRYFRKCLGYVDRVPDPQT